MVSRIWHGWTEPEDADAYEALLLEEILPGIADRGIAGYRGSHLLRRRSEASGSGGGPAEVEFVTVLWFDDMEAVRAFAGDEHEGAVVPPAAGRLLKRFDATSRHYDVVKVPG